MLNQECLGFRIPGNISYKRNNTGFLWVHKVKSKESSTGKYWKFLLRREGNYYSCSSAYLYRLFEKMRHNGFPIVLMDECKAESTLQSEGMDMAEFLVENEVFFV